MNLTEPDAMTNAPIEPIPPEPNPPHPALLTDLQARVGGSSDSILTLPPGGQHRVCLNLCRQSSTLSYHSWSL
jgi:hypothetical protein